MSIYLSVYLEVNLFGIILSLLVLFKCRRDNDRQATSLAYRRVVLATLFILLLDAAWVLLEGRPAPAARCLNNLVSAWYMFQTGLISYLWLRFVLFKLHREPAWHSVKNRLLLVPLLALLVLSVLSPFTHWLFEVTAENIYRRGPLLFLQQCIAYGYILAATACALYCALRETNRDLRADALTLCSFVVLPLLGSAVNVFFYGMPSIWPLTAISLLMVYLNLQSRQISTDALTGLNNRRQFDRHLRSAAEDAHRARPLYLVLIDIDDFKRINDTCGHLAGDHALVQAAAILKQVCGGRNVFLSRYGGDEFAIIFESGDPAAPARLMDDLFSAFDRFNAAAERPYKLTICAGAGVQPAGPVVPAAIISQADRALYAMKAEKKGGLQR